MINKDDVLDGESARRACALENKAVLVDPSGEIAFSYVKTHPVPGGGVLDLGERPRIVFEIVTITALR